MRRKRRPFSGFQTGQEKEGLLEIPVDEACTSRLGNAYRAGELLLYSDNQLLMIIQTGQK